MTTHEIARAVKSDLLRFVLIADGAFEIVGGLILVAGAGPLATLFGLNQPAVLAGLGGVLMLSGVVLIRASVHESGARRMALLAAALNIAWAIASAGVLLLGWLPLTTAGKWAVALVAEVVAFYAAVELYALWRR